MDEERPAVPNYRISVPMSLHDFEVICRLTSFYLTPLTIGDALSQQVYIYYIYIRCSKCGVMLTSSHLDLIFKTSLVLLCLGEGKPGLWVG